MTVQAQPTKQAQVEFNAGEFVKQCGTKSAAIRKLSAEGKSRGEIAKMLRIRYQHVRNVLVTPIKKQQVR